MGSQTWTVAQSLSLPSDLPTKVLIACMIAAQHQHEVHNAWNISLSQCFVRAPLEQECCQMLTFRVSAVCASTMAAA